MDLQNRYKRWNYFSLSVGPNLTTKKHREVYALTFGLYVQGRAIMSYCQENVFKWRKFLENFHCVRKKIAFFLFLASSWKTQQHIKVAGSHHTQWPGGRGLVPKGKGAPSLLLHPSVLLQRQTCLAVLPFLFFLFSTCLLFIPQS